MAIRVKYDKVTLRSNVDGVASRFQAAAARLPGRIRGAVSNDKEHAIYTELGTSKMEPHAMVRNSLPVIEDASEVAFGALSATPTEVELIAAVNSVINTAFDTIKDNTHRSLKDDPGYVHLQDAWEKEEAQAEP